MKSQLELSIEFPTEKDRNYDLGGRSFYFFDFDDNVAHLSTPIVIFHKKTREEKLLSSGEFAKHSKFVGKSGPFVDYMIDGKDEIKGSFRYFRDKDFGFLDKLFGRKQSFVHDMMQALSQPDYIWKAPSWSFFYYAVVNKRPLSIITARGHKPETIKMGLQCMVNEGHIPHLPNFLSIFPVSNVGVRKELGDHDFKLNVAELKRRAIRQSVEAAIKSYGFSPHHRFGMSDDDGHNVELITQEMMTLKKDYPEMSFFVIQTYPDRCVKREVLAHGTEDKNEWAVGQNTNAHETQLALFSDL